MGKGYLIVQVRTGDDALPIEGAHVLLWDEGNGTRFETYTDGNGNTAQLELPAPDAQDTVLPTRVPPGYSLWEVDVEKEGYVTCHYHDVEVEDGQVCILPVQMEPLVDEENPLREVDIYIPPVGLLLPDAAQTGPAEAITLRQVVVPDYITVHLGNPNNASARNVRVRFPDYIKNVTSSEIYATWPQNSILANVHAIVTFALNRVYTEWYRSRGFNFDITNHTGYDQYYRDGAQIFENISKIVDSYFNTYARRAGFRNPFFTSFCNGTTATCDGLSQWGTVTLANQGMTPLQILRYYYPNDLELVTSNNITGIVESYPGYPLSTGSSGEPVRRMQNYLNRIRVNFPLIPQIASPDGIFGPQTEQAVRAFQRAFHLTADGIIGRATWNKISFIFVGVSRLGELDSEGERVSIGATPPSVVLREGSRGADVLELQFIVNSIAPYYHTVPPVIQDGVFGFAVKNAVIEFQKTFGLTPDGVVGPATWNKLYAVYRGIYNNVEVPPAPTPPGETWPYPGAPLQVGSTGPDVRLMQAYLNTIRIIYPGIPSLVVDGTFGEATREAVVAFQNTFWLTPDGIIGPITWDYIVKQYQLLTGGVPISLEYPGTPLRVGSTGSSVRLMQEFLAELRSPYPSLPTILVDGIFGRNTEVAVLGFQRLFGLTEDGIIGPETWYEIIRRRNIVV